MRFDVRAANSLGPKRTLWLAGITSYGIAANAAASTAAASVIYAEVGLAAEYQFTPGVGLIVEAAPQYALSGGSQLTSPISFMGEASLVFWINWW